MLYLWMAVTFILIRKGWDEVPEGIGQRKGEGVQDMQCKEMV